MVFPEYEDGFSLEGADMMVPLDVNQLLDEWNELEVCPTLQKSV